MKLEVFQTIIETLERQERQTIEIAKLGIDLLEFNEDWLQAVHLALYAYYGKEGGEWISWYLYERPVSLDEPAARDKDGNPICYDIPSLWKYVEEIRVSEDFEEYELPKKPEPGRSNLLNLLSS